MKHNRVRDVHVCRNIKLIGHFRNFFSTTSQLDPWAGLMRINILTPPPIKLWIELQQFDKFPKTCCYLSCGKWRWKRCRWNRRQPHRHQSRPTILNTAETSWRRPCLGVCRWTLDQSPTVGAICSRWFAFLSFPFWRYLSKISRCS